MGREGNYQMSGAPAHQRSIEMESVVVRGEEPLTIIERSRGWTALHLKEIWDYRELLFFLTWRDIKVRYKQTVVGAAWAIIQPVFSMVVFSVLFGRLAKVPSDGIPYPLFTFTALLPWQLFAFALTQSSNSVVSSENLITKVYFPRLVVPVSSVLAGLLDFGIAFLILVLMMIYYGVKPTWAIAAVPLFVLLAIATALAAGLWLSALNVRYRDVRHTLTFLTQIWLLVTPVAYPVSLIPAKWRPFYALNPMAGVVEGFRWALLGKAHPPLPVLLVSTSVVALIIFGGLEYFRRMEKTFADIV